MQHPETTALIIIDVQNDFCPGGALEVSDGDRVVPVINSMAKDFSIRVLTQDWHPKGHSSFADTHKGAVPFSVVDRAYGPQVLWPRHCVQGSGGAAFHRDLDTTSADLIVRKGFRTEIDSYSAFFENDHETPTGLTGYLHTRGVTDLVMVGLATDFCVRFSAVDGAKLGFGVTVRENACRAIDLDGSLAVARQDMLDNGVSLRS